jgi:hypothetical protein
MIQEQSVNKCCTFSFQKGNDSLSHLLDNQLYVGFVNCTGL